MSSLYILGIIVAILSGLLLKSTVFKGNPVPFVMELPAYRMPSARSVVLHMWEKGKDFVHKAFTVIFIGTIVIWFLQSFDWSLNMVSDSSASILASIGSVIAPLFIPLGFKDWRASTALISGLTAKESVKSTLAVLTGCHQRCGTFLSAQHHVYTVKRIFIFGIYDFIYALYCGVCGDEAGTRLLSQGNFNRCLSDRCGVFGCNGDLSDRQIVDRLISAVPEAQNGKGRMKMSPADWIVLAILAALVIAVVMIMVKRRKEAIAAEDVPAVRNAAVAKQNGIPKNNEHFAEHGSIFSKKIEPFSQKEAENRMKILS